MGLSTNPKFSAGRVMSMAGNVSWLFSAASQIAHLNSLNELWGKLGAFGSEVQFIVHKLLLPWRMLGQAVTSIVPFELPEYAFDAAILTLLPILYLRQWLVKRAVNDLERARAEFADNISPLFLQPVSLDKLNAQCDEIANRIGALNSMPFFALLYGPPLEFLRYRLGETNVVDAFAKQVKANVYISHLDAALSESHKYMSEYFSKVKKRLIVFSLILVVIVVDISLHQKHFVLWEFLLYSGGLAVILTLLLGLLYALPWFLAHVYCLFISRSPEERMTRFFEIMSKVPRFRLRIKPVYNLKDHLPSDYLFYEGKKRDEAFFDKMMWESARAHQANA